MDCVDLKAEFGSQFRVIPEPGTYQGEYGESARTSDPWLLIVPCKFGHIYPHGKSMLGVSVDTRGKIAKRISELPFVTVVQDGDDGINAIFHKKHFLKIAELVVPRKRRKLSEEHKAKLLKATEQYRYKPKTSS